MQIINGIGAALAALAGIFCLAMSWGQTTWIAAGVALIGCAIGLATTAQIAGDLHAIRHALEKRSEP